MGPLAVEGRKAAVSNKTPSLPLSVLRPLLPIQKESIWPAQAHIDVVRPSYEIHALDIGRGNETGFPPLQSMRYLRPLHQSRFVRYNQPVVSYGILTFQAIALLLVAIHTESHGILLGFGYNSSMDAATHSKVDRSIRG